MKIVFKRFFAYFIDILLVSLVATFISSNSYMNKDYKKYEETYKNYNNEYNEYTEYYTKLQNYYEDDELSEKEYNKLLKLENKYANDLKSYYKDKKITNKEYNIIIEKLNEKYSNKELNYNYKLLKYSIIPTIINLMCILLYFVVFQFYFNGQTLGKKIMKLKVISNNDKELTIFNFFIRSLIVNEVFLNTLNIIFLIILSKNSFITYNQIIYVITYIIEMAIISTILFDKNNRGIHDYICNTKIIEDKKE